MRIYLLWVVILFFTFYAWKDWWKTLCFLIVLMAFIERPDMPKTVFNIPGMNPWNLLMMFTLMAFWVTEKKGGRAGIKIEGRVVFLIWWYLAVILISFARGIVDLGGVIEYATLLQREVHSKRDFFIDDLINVLKYTLPGLLFFLGCNSLNRFKWGLLSVLIMNLLLALLVIKATPLGYLSDGYSLQKAAIRIIDRDIGYYRSDLAVLLGGGAWAIYAYRSLFKGAFLGISTNIAAVLTTFAIALTGGRIGVGSWAVSALALAYLRWRRFLVYAPILALIVIATVPAVQERVFQGFSGDEEVVERRNPQTQDVIESTEGSVDMVSVTSGRTVIWPLVIEKIGESPLIGYGRHAMQRSGVSLATLEMGNPFPHPHNAYLQMLLDNGWLLSLPVFFFYFLLVRYSISLFKDDSSGIYVAAGGAGIAFILAQLVGCVAGQSFYPMASQVSMWCVIGLVLRLYYERERIRKEFGSEAGAQEYADPWKMSRTYMEAEASKKKNKRRNFYMQS
ncbi:MAG: O-antigen ligase family protein [Chromatiales bacterium]|jgi:O-antigen ligase